MNRHELTYGTDPALDPGVFAAIRALIDSIADLIHRIGFANRVGRHATGTSA